MPSTNCKSKSNNNDITSIKTATSRLRSHRRLRVAVIAYGCLLRPTAPWLAGQLFCSGLIWTLLPRLDQSVLALCLVWMAGYTLMLITVPFWRW